MRIQFTLQSRKDHENYKKKREKRTKRLSLSWQFLKADLISVTLRAYLNNLNIKNLGAGDNHPKKAFLIYICSVDLKSN